MMRLLAAMLLVPAAPLAAQVVPTPAPAPQVTSAPAPLPRVALDTAQGRIVLEIETVRAPVTAGNFLRYVDAKRLDGISFYRTAKGGERFGFVQFGVRDGAKLYPPIRHEPTTQTEVRHTDGAISVARFAPGTAQADFTISVGDQPSLDANAAAPGDNQGFAAFGHVVEGMEVVQRILDAPTSATAGDGVMRGQMLSPTVTIRSARRLP